MVLLMLLCLQGCCGMPIRTIGGQLPDQFWRDQSVKTPGGV